MAEPSGRQKLAFYLGFTIPRHFEPWIRHEFATPRWPWLYTVTTMLFFELPLLAVVAALLDSWSVPAFYVSASLIIRPLVWGKTRREARLRQLERKWDRSSARLAER